MSQQLNNALALAGLGFRVFPVHSPVPGGCSCRRGPACTNVGKHPRIKRFPTLAATDPDTIGAWWSRWPDSNIGVATGRGLVVVDIDAEEGLTTFLWLAGVADDVLQRDTPVVRTGSGGLHVYYRLPAGRVARNRQKRAGTLDLPGVDIRGEGGFVVAPGSVHRSGDRYRCLTSMDALAELPAALAEALTEPGPPGAAMGPGSRLGRGTARWPAPAPRARRTPTEGRRETALAPASAHEAGRLLRQMVERYPIAGTGRRNEQVRAVVWYLARTGRPPELIRRVGFDYLRHFEGVYATPLPEAIDHLGDLIDRTVAKFERGERAAIRQQDHVDRARALGLSYHLNSVARWSRHASCPPNPVSSPGPLREGTKREERVRGTRGVPACRTEPERAFVRGVICWTRYKLLDFEEPEILLTDGQLIALCSAWGCPVGDRTTIRRLRAKYFTQGERTASVLELLVRTGVGRRVGGEGLPSRYIPSPLLVDLLRTEPEWDDEPEVGSQ